LIFSSPPVRRHARGFTLLEMIMVLVILAILAGLSLPSVESAFTEQGVRRDSHQLALMVKTAMIQSADQNRAYEIDLSPTEMALHPVGEAAADPTADAATTDGDTSSDSAKPVDIVVTSELDPANKLMVPDPIKANAWESIPPTTWIFKPGELCPATRVRFSRGEAYVETSFDALTGNVVDETASIP
jgi:prepilin-type N-terminal cleavage/methylation domain-containing protein